MKDCLKDISKVTRKVSLNVKEGTAKKGSWTPQKPVIAQLASQMRLPEPKDVQKSSLLEPQSTELMEWPGEYRQGLD